MTAPGHAAFVAWLAALAKEAARPDQLRSPLTLVVFFGELLPVPLLRRALQEHRIICERRLEQLTGMLAALSPADDLRLPTEVLRRGIALAELHLRWIDDVLELLSTRDPVQDELSLDA